MFLDAMITYDRSTWTREAFKQEAASFVVSFSDPRMRPAGPTREAPARQGPSGRQLCITFTKKANPQARSAGSTRGSAENNSRVMMA